MGAQCTYSILVICSFPGRLLVWRHLFELCLITLGLAASSYICSVERSITVEQVVTSGAGYTFKTVVMKGQKGNSSPSLNIWEQLWTLNPPLIHKTSKRTKCKARLFSESWLPLSILSLDTDDPLFSSYLHIAVLILHCLILYVKSSLLSWTQYIII